ncbi:MAG: hypothetical protein F4Y37_16925 [Caldilineaceae bacterium SB0664_bin_22]|nr:hypothetical protein [Caldilineaceae bacterium SB0664_bin_22]
MTNEARVFRSAWLALLVLIVISGGSLAAGDLFDDDFTDCPVKTRLRDGQISGLMVVRDADDADEVNVSWTGTNPDTWGLGPNAYRASLVAILDDGARHNQDFALGTRKATFDGIRTGIQVTVEMAIVVDTVNGSYVVSDILRTSIHQSLTEPSFGSGWYQLIDEVGGNRHDTQDLDPDTPGHQYDTEKISGGMMYYIGYNENFANYRKGTAEYTHKPLTSRLRIGLAHSANETDGARDDVEFDAYIIRIVDSDGDVVTEGDDVPTIKTNYGLGRNSLNDAGTQTLNKLFVHDLNFNRYPLFTDRGTVIISRDGNQLAYSTDFAFDANVHQDTGIVLSNVRVVDGFKVTQAMHRLPMTVLGRTDNSRVSPPSVSTIKVDTTGDGQTGYRDAGQVFANPPDEHRDFPIDTLSSDETYRITAWAVNEDDEVISPVATLVVRPQDKTVTLADSDSARFTDYLNPPENTLAVTEGTLIVTDFTVSK